MKQSKALILDNIDIVINEVFVYDVHNSFTKIWTNIQGPEVIRGWCLGVGFESLELPKISNVIIHRSIFSLRGENHIALDCAAGLMW